MAARQGRGRGRRRLLAVRDREIVRTAVVNTLVLLVLAVAAWAFAPRLAAVGFWEDRFAAHDPRFIVPLVALPLLVATWAPALWPQTWEGELSGRALRAVAAGAFLYWTTGVLLRAPEAAAAFLVPTLAGVLFTALGILRRLRRERAAGRVSTVAVDGPGAVLGAALSTAGAVGVVVVVALSEPRMLTFAFMAPFAVLYVAGIPFFWRRQRHAVAVPGSGAARPSGLVATVSAGHPYDLDPETLVPPASALALYVTAFAAAFGVLLVSPGVPLSGPVAWLFLVFALPTAVRAMLRRSGIAHPRGLVGPPEARVHRAVVEHLSDATLNELDDALERFIRTGRGRRRLARTLAELLEPAVPGADRARLVVLLRGLPRWPWARKRRQQGLATLLSGQEILEALA